MNLLYPHALTAETDESFRKDADALQALELLEIGKLLVADEKDLFRLLTANPDVIRYRQAQFHDLMTVPGLADVLRKTREYIGQLRELSRKRAALGSTTEDILYSFGEVSLFLDMIRDLTAAADALPPLSSEGLCALFDLLRHMAADEHFSDISVLIEKLQKGIKMPCSITLGLNLDVTFGVHEAGVVSINDDYYTNSGFFATVFGKKASEGDLKVFMPLVSPEASAGFESVVYNALNTTISRSFAKARAQLLSYIRETVSALYPLYDDLTFLLTGYDFLASLAEKRLTVCDPAQGTTLSAKKLKNPALLAKMKSYDITASDILPHDDVTIRLITGPNAGGKSVFLRSVGIAALLAALGLPVPAEACTLPAFSAVYCHFPAKDSADDSRLVEECKTMRAVLDAADEHSLILMDETFSGTNSSEGAVIAAEVIKTLQSRHIPTFYSTHLHDLADQIPVFNTRLPHVLPLSAGYEDGKRTYRIVEGNADRFSYAMEIARAYGLAFEENGK